MSNDYFFEDGTVKHQVNQKEKWENTILETVINALLERKDVLEHVENYINEYRTNKKLRSHDNVTACLVYAARAGRYDLVNKVKIFPKHLHPRDIIFIAYVQKRFWAKWFLPVLTLIFKYMVHDPYKVRPDMQERLFLKKNQYVNDNLSFEQWRACAKKIMYFGELVRESEEIYIPSLKYKTTYRDYRNPFGYNYTIRTEWAVDTERIFWIRQQLPVSDYPEIQETYKDIEERLQEKYETTNWFRVTNQIYFRNSPGHPNIKD